MKSFRNASILAILMSFAACGQSFAAPSCADPEEDKSIIKLDCTYAKSDESLTDISYAWASYVIGDTVNIRNGPGSRFRVVGRVFYGEVVHFTGHGKGEWAQIYYGNRLAWININFVE